MPMSPRLLRPRAAGGFDPRTIAGLEIWLDATAIAAADAPSDQIENWRSKGSSAFVYSQSTPNNRPTLFESSSDVQTATRATINGLQAAFFDGTNDRLTTASTRGDAQYTAFAVIRPASVSIVQGVFSRDAGGGVPTRGPSLLRLNSANLNPFGFTSTVGVSFNASQGTLAVNTPAIVHVLQTATGLSAFVNNNGSAESAGVQNDSAQASAVGANNATGTSGFFTGLIGEILYFSRALSTAEQGVIYNYLVRRWKL